MVLGAFIFRILTEFSFVYTDQDQLIMWFGLQEFSLGRFHTFRYLGQDYGSMIEAFLALPLNFLPYHLSLPIVSTALLLWPYVLIGRSTNIYWGFIGTFLLLIPIEYFMITMVPRDFSTGIAVTALALIFLKSDKSISLVLVGFLCLLGWIVNHNAALLGAVISVFASFDNQKLDWRRIKWILCGYGIGVLVYLGLEIYDHFHQHLIVHRAWKFHYAWKQVWDGWKNLDRHWRWITPLVPNAGWFYIIIWFAFGFFCIRKRLLREVISLSALLILTFAAFGILKVHDGYNSVFMSHERMFLALPVATIFLIAQIRFSSKWMILFVLVGLGYGMQKHWILSDRIDSHVNSTIKDRLYYLGFKVVDIERECGVINELMKEYDVSYGIYGAFDWQIGYQHNNACSCYDPSLNYCFPEYDRKTWITRSLRDDSISKVMFIGFPELHDSDNKKWLSERYEITEVSNHFVDHAFLIEGENLNALEVFEYLGHTLGPH